MITDDFRSSLDPRTAVRRNDYYRGLISVLEADIVVREAKGKAPRSFRSVDSALINLFQAQVAFAEAQIEAAKAASAAEAQAGGEGQ